MKGTNVVVDVQRLLLFKLTTLEMEMTPKRETSFHLQAITFKKWLSHEHLSSKHFDHSGYPSGLCPPPSPSISMSNVDLVTCV